MQYVSYLRVSTRGQGESGLGLEGQRKAVENMVRARHGEIIAEFTEVESGRNNYRIELTKALEYTKLFDATLIIANISRLARNAAFVLQLQESGVKFMCADMPDANDFTVGIMALVAQRQAKDISDATKRGLEAAKARGTKLGGRRPACHNFSDEDRAKGRLSRQQKRMRHLERLRPVLEEIYRENGPRFGASKIAKILNERKVPMVSGKRPGENGAKWRQLHVMRILRDANIERGTKAPPHRPETEKAPSEQRSGPETAQ